MKIIIVTVIFFVAFNVFAGGWEKLYNTSYFSENDIFFATENTGWIVGTHEIRKTTDGGKTWVKQFTDNSHSYYVIEMYDSLNGYVGGSSASMLKTNDGGITWENVECNLTSKRIYSMAVISKDSLWISTSGGEILFSPDGGKTWELQLDVTSSLYSLDVKYGYGIACGKTIDDIYYSTDLINWNKANKTDISSHAYTKSTLYAAAISGDTSAVIMGWGTDVLLDQPTIIVRSTNKGLDWTYQEQTNSVYTIIKDIYFKNESVGYAVGGSSRLGTVVLKTVDAGKNWSRLNYPLGTTGFRIHGAGNTVGIIGSLGAKYISNDDGISFNLYDSKPEIDFNSIELLSNGKIVVAGDYGLIAVSEDIGNTWKIGFASDKGLSPHIFDLDFVDDNTGFAAGYYGVLFKTEDGGSSWSAIFEGNTSIKYKNYSVDFFNHNKGVVVGSDVEGAIIYNTNNGGIDWDTLHFPNIKEFYSVSILNESEVVVSGYGKTILKSSDGGSNFSEAVINGIPSNKEIGEIVNINFLDENLGVACGSGAILVTKDKGDSWDYITVPDTNKSTYDGIFALSEHHWVTFSSKSIYETTDAGSTWNNIEDSIVTEAINYIAYNNGLWVVGNDGLILNYKDYTDVRDNILLVDNFKLLQNYPNPFNPTTKISFELNEETKASLIVYNSLGQKVRELINGNLQKGRYNLTFNAADLSSGVYFYTLKTSGSSQTKKMILLK